MSLPFVLEHIDLIAAAPEGVKRLRELILELAVRGKLVPQDPNDEPAGELLKRIQAEKAKLVAEGRIRKDKPLPEVGEDEKAFELPVGWELRRIDELLQITGGVTLGRKLHGRELMSLPYLRVANVQRGYLVLDIIKNVEVPIDEIGKYQLHQDDLLITEGGDWDKVGRTAIWNSEITQCLHQNHVFRARKVVADWNSRWAEMYLNSFSAREYFAGSSKQTTNLASINMTQLRGCVFPVPPLAEQHRIVAKVDELMALCDRLEAQQADAASAHATLVKILLDTLTQSQSAADFTANWQRIAQHFDTLFTTEASLSALKQTVLQLAVMGKLVPQDPNDEPASELLKRIQAEKAKLVAEGNIKKDKPLPEIGEDEQTFELPYGWEWVRFGAITRVCSELVKPEDFMNSFQVAPDCIEKGTGKLMERRTVRESGVRGPNQRFYSGQLLYSKIRPSLSKAVLVDFDGLCSADMYPLETHINRRFLLTEILSEVFLSQVRVAENRVKMPKLNQESLALFVVAVPPLPEQHRIVAKVDELMALCDQLAVRLKAARELAAQYATAATEAALEAA
jgi:type I restriction enzyme S subunit